MNWLLDTNTCIDVIRRKSLRVLQHFRQHQPGHLGVSTVTLAELRYGADKSSDPTKNHGALDMFLVPLDISDFDAEAAEYYGKVRTDLEQRGLAIGPLDMMIAAHALSLGVPVVTNNTREFSRVNGLSVEDWSSRR